MPSVPLATAPGTWTSACTYLPWRAVDFSRGTQRLLWRLQVVLVIIRSLPHDEHLPGVLVRPALTAFVDRSFSVKLLLVMCTASRMQSSQKFTSGRPFRNAVTRSMFLCVLGLCHFATIGSYHPHLFSEQGIVVQRKVIALPTTATRRFSIPSEASDPAA